MLLLLVLIFANSQWPTAAVLFAFGFCQKPEGFTKY